MPLHEGLSQGLLRVWFVVSVLARLRPDTLAGRITLLLTVAILVANAVAFTLFTFARDDFDRRAGEARERERVLALVPAMEAVSAPVRESIARDASTRFARIGVSSVPLVAQSDPGSRATGLARTLAAATATAAGDREIAVTIADRLRAGNADRAEPDSGEAGPRNNRRAPEIIRISVRLSDRDGQAAWLNIETTAMRPPDQGTGLRAFAIIVALSLFFVLGGAILFARRLAGPLRALARAATLAGRGDRTARVAEEGPREVRIAAAAFNAMQAEIGRFDAERMRTLAAVGHDLRTPMTSLRLRVEMVDDADLREPMIHTLEEMRVMADGLVTYARDGRDGEATQDVDLRDLLVRLCADRGAVLSDGPPVTVRGRPVSLGRVIGNLVDNALRYGESARLALDHRNGAARITIDDDGPGIPEDRLEEMFQPFVRGDASRSTETGGTGLGLSIARSIVASHGGTLTLQNRPEGGLRATITLPDAASV